MIYKFERNIMTNKVAAVGLAVLLMSTAGCVTKPYYSDKNCEDGVCTSNREYTAICVENADGYSECTEASNVNYTKTAAQFREYGERTPRDHRITQAGAGNNISAAVPPSINNEVIAYQAQVNGTPVQGGAAGQPNSPAVNGVVPAANSHNPAGVPLAQGTNNNYTPQIDPVSGQPVYNNIGNVNNGANGVNMPQSSVQQVDARSGSENETEKQDWLAEEGQSLKELLTLWSEEAGWRLIWKTNRNYTLNAGAMFRGNFADVASALVRAFARARPAPVATFYKGNRVLVIETMEDENAYD